MKLRLIAFLALLAISLSGCINDRTERMASTCQALLESGARDGVKTFVRDAEEQIASLERPAGKLERMMRDVQDPDAMQHKASLEQCLWRLKTNNP